MLVVTTTALSRNLFNVLTADLILKGAPKASGFKNLRLGKLLLRCRGFLQNEVGDFTPCS